MTPLNAKYTTNGAIFEESDDSYIPGLGDTSGTNYFDRNLQVLRIVSHFAKWLHLCCQQQYDCTSLYPGCFVGCERR